MFIVGNNSFFSFTFIAGWSNFCTLVGHFSKLFKLAGLNWLKTLIFLPNSGCSLKKKGLQSESIFEILIFVPKSGCSLKKKKKVFNWNRSSKFLFSCQNHSVLRKKRLPLPVIEKTSAKLFCGLHIFHPWATCGLQARSWTTLFYRVYILNQMY